MVNVSAIVRAETSLLSDSSNNELIIINLTTVPGRRNSKIPPAKAVKRKAVSLEKTSQNIMASKILERKTNALALNYKKDKMYPSVVVGAEFSYFKRVEKSGPINPNILVITLRNNLVKIGDLYTKVNGNTIGCCAEVNSANQILIKRPFLKLDQIEFSKALRPRTMQEIPKCNNCKLTFQ